MTLSLDFSKLAPLITPKTLILTPNARTQKAIYSGEAISYSDQQVFSPADVRSFSQWQAHLWSELSFYRISPTKVSSLSIKSWLENLVTEEQDWALTNPSGVATKVLEAYQNLIQWEIELSDVSTDESVEIDYFCRWINKLDHFCLAKKLIPEFLILKNIKQNLSQIIKEIPKHILLVGFNQLTPLQQNLFNELKKHDIKIENYQYKIKPEQSSQLQFSSIKDELAFAANYAKNYIEQQNENSRGSGKKIQSESGCIGIVVENLAAHLAEVHQTFSGVFQPEECKPWVALKKPKYNVSAGFPLAEQPLVKAALFLLNLKSNQLTLDELHFLKNTPFIDWGEQTSATKHFLHQLCINARKEYSFGFILKQIKAHTDLSQLSILRECLEKQSEISLGAQRLRNHIVQWHEILINWKWIGVGRPSGNDEIENNNPLNEFESQLVERLFEVLHECETLNEFSDNVSYHGAIKFLNLLTQQHSFQIASDRSDVHVLGILEATGLQFDELVIVGFNHVNWPQSNRINPFLPLSLQREKNMPGSSSEREFEYAKDLSLSLLNSANKIIVTSSDSDSASDKTVSSFFAKLPVKSESEFFSEDDASNSQANKDVLPDYQWIEDSSIHLSESEITDIKGGAYLLSEYAQCPFKSMTNYQLKLSDFDEPQVGIDPLIRGRWLHETMEAIWKELVNQKSLLLLTKGELEKLILESLKSVLPKFQPYLLSVTEQTLVDLETEKLFVLIFEWMEIEKIRDEFSILALEENVQLQLADLDLNFRIDRVDINASNKIEIIDYKTGKTNLNNWFGVRPTEAQMPAYILATKDKESSGLNYARIKVGEVAQSGIRFEQTEQASKIKIDAFEQNVNDRKVSGLNKLNMDSFDELVSQWQQTLTRMATGITSGYMPVSPKDTKQSCTFCHYRAFCRIDEEQPDEKG